MFISKFYQNLLLLIGYDSKSKRPIVWTHAAADGKYVRTTNKKMAKGLWNERRGWLKGCITLHTSLSIITNIDNWQPNKDKKSMICFKKQCTNAIGFVANKTDGEKLTKEKELRGWSLGARRAKHAEIHMYMHQLRILYPKPNLALTKLVLDAYRIQQITLSFRLY